MKERGEWAAFSPVAGLLLCNTAALLLVCEVLVYLFIYLFIIYLLIITLLLYIIIIYFITIIYYFSYYFIKDIKSSSFCVCWYPFDHFLPYVLRWVSPRTGTCLFAWSFLVLLVQVISASHVLALHGATITIQLCGGPQAYVSSTFSAKSPSQAFPTPSFFTPCLPSPDHSLRCPVGICNVLSVHTTVVCLVLLLPSFVDVLDYILFSLTCFF